MNLPLIWVARGPHDPMLYSFAIIDLMRDERVNSLKQEILTYSALWTVRQFVREADVSMTLINNCVILDSSDSHFNSKTFQP